MRCHWLHIMESVNIYMCIWLTIIHVGLFGRERCEVVMSQGAKSNDAEKGVPVVDESFRALASGIEYHSIRGIRKASVKRVSSQILSMAPINPLRALKKILALSEYCFFWPNSLRNEGSNSHDSSLCVQVKTALKCI